MKRRTYLRNVSSATLSSVVVGSELRRAANRPSDTASEFVYRDEEHLRLAEDRFWLHGTNNQHLPFLSLPRSRIRSFFRRASELGLSVVRTFGCVFLASEPKFQPEPGTYDESVFERMDFIVKTAKDHGIRLVVPFVDYWAEEHGGMKMYTDWSETADGKQDFYTDEQAKRLYKDYVREFVRRENTLTGVEYRDEPAILMWELANEPRATDGDAFRDWIAEMSAFVKDIDPNHLVSTGEEGFYAANRVGYGNDFLRDHAVSDVDVCSFHLWPQHWDISVAEGREWIRRHVEDARNRLGKPAYLGEFGWFVERNPTDRDQLRKRNEAFETWCRTLRERDSDGGLVWRLNWETGIYSGLPTDVFPSDESTTEILHQFSKKITR